ncbi:unnamed protein product [Prorocentrum cordatum]|uniref:Uncharacterized protein n=1 Tax=Prorocentrum cordatum TaxID=2364126 RepID=A0ABN9UEF7_9DINO|nr:unnamed protein product [Polarella glacialis]
MVKALHDRKAEGEDVGLSTSGPPFTTAFCMTTRALLLMTPDEIQQKVEEHFNPHLKEESMQYIGMIRHFTVRAPRGPGPKKLEDTVRLQYALGPNPLSSEVNWFLDAALTDLKATQPIRSDRWRDRSQPGCSVAVSECAAAVQRQRAISRAARERLGGTSRAN